MSENKYTLTLKPPPFREPAFWSATMYSFENNYTVENPINRYSLGSDNPLTMNKDGTVTLYMQSTARARTRKPTGTFCAGSGIGYGGDQWAR